MYPLLTLIDVREDTYVGVWSVCWGRIGQVVGEIGGEVFPSQCIFASFVRVEIGRQEISL